VAGEDDGARRAVVQAAATVVHDQGRNNKRQEYAAGERPRHPDAPQLEGTGEIRLESEDRARGYWTTRSERTPELNARTSGVYLRADPADLALLDSGDAQGRAELIASRLRDWEAIANS